MNPRLKPRRFVGALFGGALFVGLCSLILHASAAETSSAATSRPQWQYLSGCFSEQDLEGKGTEGWELVAVSSPVEKWKLAFSAPLRYDSAQPVPLSEARNVIGEITGQAKCMMYLKRQK